MVRWCGGAAVRKVAWGPGDGTGKSRDDRKEPERTSDASTPPGAGKLNHNIRCTLRGYRNLSGDFTGNTIYTGFKKIYVGKSQVRSGSHSGTGSA